MSGVQRLARQRATWRDGIALNEVAFSFLALAGEVLVIIAASLATGMAYHQITYGGVGPLRTIAASGALTALFFAGPLLARGDYSVQSFLHGQRRPARIVYGWSCALLALGAVAFLTKTTAEHSRGAVALFAVLGLVGLVGYNLVMQACVLALLRAGRLARRRIMLIGTEVELQRYSERRGKVTGLERIIGVAALPPLEGDRDSPERARQVDQAMARAVSAARHYGAADVVLLGPCWTGERLDRCLDTLSVLPVAVHRDIGPAMDPLVDMRIGRVGALATLPLTGHPLNPLQALLKRSFDVVASVAGLILLTPAFLVVAWLIRRDSPGPVFFLQRRLGFNQREFRIIKFRTMRTLDDGAVVPQARANDPRVTRVGTFLRRWSIDELPQLINVLKGEMSIVGPRPHAVAHDIMFEKRIGGYARRLNVKPGITGWAQVNGLRGETDTDDKMAQRVSHDLYYIDNWSLLLDVSIILRTILTPKAFRNAL